MRRVQVGLHIISISPRPPASTRVREDTKTLANAWPRRLKPSLDPHQYQFGKYCEAGARSSGHPMEGEDYAV